MNKWNFGKDFEDDEEFPEDDDLDDDGSDE